MRLNEDGKTVAAMDVLCPGWVGSRHLARAKERESREHRDISPGKVEKCSKNIKRLINMCQIEPNCFSLNN